MAGSAPATSPSASRGTPSGPAEPEGSLRIKPSSAGSTALSVPRVARSAPERRLSRHVTFFASRSSLQSRMPTLRQSAVASS